MEPYSKTERSGIHIWQHRESSTFDSNDKETKIVTDSVNPQTWTNSLNGFKNPGWKDAVKAVRSATTHADGRKVVCSYSPYYCERWGWTAKPFQPAFHRHGVVYGNIPWTGVVLHLNPGTISTISADNQAIAKLYSRLTSFETSVEGGQDFGEVKETINAIRRPLHPIQKVLTKALKGQIKALNANSLKSLVKGLGDVYLEFQFGWNPLARDLADAMVGLQNRSEFAYYHNFSAAGETQANPVLSFVDFTLGVISIRWSERQLDTASVRYSGVWATGVDVPERSVSTVLGMQASHFIPTIWNLIPYTFLIDYFTNIGDIMNSISVPWGGVRWCNKTVRTSRLYETSASRGPAQTVLLGNGFDMFVPGSFSIEDVRFTRDAVGGLPIPTFELSWGASDRQLLNIAALLAGRLPVLGKAVAKAQARYPKASMDFSRVPSINLR